VLAVITFFAQDGLDLVQLPICTGAGEVEGTFQDRGMGEAGHEGLTVGNWALRR